MKEIIALQQYTDKHISLYEGQIRNIEDTLALDLINKGVVAEHNQTSPSSGNSGSNLKYVKDDPSDNGGVIEGLVEGNTGEINVASGKNAHAEGGIFFEENGTTSYMINTASGESSHAEGYNTTASGEGSHAEGSGTRASGNFSHAEGVGTTASEYTSHAEGNGTTASEYTSHAEGSGTVASGENSHAEGDNTIANHKSQHVIGDFNIADPSTTANNLRGNYVCIIGNGTDNDHRSNALAIKWDGTLVLSDGTEVTQAQIKALLALLNT